MSYLDYARRGRNAGWRYVVGLIGGLLLMVAIAVPLIVGLAAFHLIPSDFAQSIQDASQPTRFYPANGAMFALLLLSFALVARWLHGKAFGDIVGAWTWRRFGQGLGIWTVVLLAATAVDFLIAPKGFRITANGQTPLLAAVALGALAVQTFAEEFVFRGYLTQGLLLATRGRTVPAALISGALFGAMHIPNGVPQAVSATIFGIALAFLAIRTGGLAFGYGLHLANNFFGAAVLVSGDDVFHGSPGLLTQSTPQLMWWDVAMGAVGLALVTAWMLRSRAATTSPHLG